MIMDGAGFASDWKNVVTSITNPKIGVMQKLRRSPIIPISNIVSVPPNAIRICFGKIITIIHMIQVIPTEKAVA